MVGFDDIPIARYVTPPLTTMRVDIAELGRRAFALLLDAIGNPAAHDAAARRVATTLVVRKSCGGSEIATETKHAPHRAARWPKEEFLKKERCHETNVVLFCVALLLAATAFAQTSTTATHPRKGDE